MARVNLDKFYTDPDWKTVEEILMDCLKELSYEPDENTNPADFKAQTLSNKKLKTAVKQFLSQAKVLTTVDLKESKNPFE